MSRDKYGCRLDGIGEFGTWLVQELRDNDLTTIDLAGLLRTSRQNISEYIHKKRKPSYVMILAICYILNHDPITVYQLVEEDWG